MRIARQQKRAAHHILEFAHVARPRVSAQHCQCAVAQPRHRGPFRCVAQQHRESERGDVGAAFAQRGQREREHVEPVIKVGAEAAFVDFERQVAVGAGDHAHIDPDWLGRAERHNFAFLEHAQQLGLERQRHLSDFVKQQRPAVGCAEETLGRGMGAGERALLVPEQQSFEHRLGHCRAIHADEWASLAWRAIVDEAAEHFFAGAGGASDQHRDFALRDTFRQRQHREGLRVGRDRAAGAARCGDQRGLRRGAVGIGIVQRERRLAGRTAFADQCGRRATFEPDRSAVRGARSGSRRRYTGRRLACVDQRDGRFAGCPVTQIAQHCSRPAQQRQVLFRRPVAE